MYSIVELYKKHLYDISYDSMGRKTIERISGFRPTLGLECDRETGWKSYDGKNVERIEFPDISEFSDYLFINNQVENIFGNVEPQYQYIAKQYAAMQYDLSRIKTAFVDIEVHCNEGFPFPESARWPISAISVKDSRTKKFYVAATKPFEKVRTVTGVDPRNINFRRFEDDSQILMWLIQVRKHLKADVWCGWYSDNFDFPYIINRFGQVFEDPFVVLGLSPLTDMPGWRPSSSDVGDYGMVSTRQVDERNWRTVIRGLTLYDYMRLYKKFIFKPRERYSLDFIAGEELGETKIDYSEFDNLWDLWEANPQKYIDYNMYDVELIDMLDAKLGLIDLAFTLAYEAKVNPIDVMGTTKIWDIYFYNALLKDRIMVPRKPDNREIEAEAELAIEEGRSDSYTGAYVKDPEKKIFDWVISYDLNSLYPHLQQQFNISPDCICDGVTEEVTMQEVSPHLLNRNIEVDPRYILAGNGQYFRKDREGFIPRILRRIYDERTVFKREMLKKKQELVDLKEAMKRRGFSID